ncbi:MAG: hypothetical protein H7257_01175 [Taibaiella sp.]|nr:hypothetical protein [Taibaiella sp.]
MDTSAALLDILKYTIPAFIVLISTSLIVNRFLISQTQRKQLSLFQESQDITLRLRLQAYERMVILVERIGPRQILTRVYDSSMTVLDLRQVLTFSILAEFEHNLSQQIYVSKNVWETVKNVKEQEISMVNQVAQKMDQDAPAKELYSKILDYVLQTESQNPTDVALTIINDEVRKVMAFGSY